MQRSTLATIGKAGSVLLLVFSIPWVVYGQMGMGGMGGMGGGGMGGMGPVMSGVMSSRDKLLEELTKNPVEWERPEGEVPFWLKNGKVACDSTELVRNRLNETEELAFSEVSLSAFFQSLSEKTGIQFDLDTKAFEEAGVGEAALTNKEVGPLRELLRRALEPLKLTYIVHENSVEITTIDAASSRPVIRHYDLGYIQSDSKNLASIIATIEQAVEPDTWINSGGNGSIMPIGQLLVVSTTEKAHLGIEKLLYRLSPQSAVQPGMPASNLLGGGEASPLKKSNVLPEEKAMIEGVVTFRGKPIVANLAFHAEGGTVIKDISYNLNGQYELMLPTGNYAITLDNKEVPAKYRTVEDSPLKYKVESGRNLFDIELDDSPRVTPSAKR
jgi:hypothetical protein